MKSQTIAGIDRYRLQKILQNVGVFLLCTVLAIGFLIPLFWMISTSLKNPRQIFTYPMIWIPDPVLWRNYITAWNTIPFLRFTINSFYFVFFALAGDMLSSSLAAYSFARLRFPGRNLLFLLCLSTLMIPAPVTMIPQFILFSHLGVIDTYVPLILPSWLAFPFWVFLLRQFFMTLPLELDEAAKIDGCGFFMIYWRILMPLAKPGLATIAVFSFIGNWKKFMEPLIYLNSQEKFPISLGLRLFQGLYATQWELLMAASTIAIVPCVVLYFLAQKYFMRGIVISGGKG